MGVHPSRKHVVRRRHVRWLLWDIVQLSFAVILLATAISLAYVAVGLFWGGS